MIYKRRQQPARRRQPQLAQQVHPGIKQDCIASGAIWVDMRETGVDVLISWLRT
ncbi:hypothetical protein VB636_02770 [Paracoccus sp. APAP_BH8]|uniref:hypothetical protein n=1 Tax=Paracoccus sp. APAP_BH8 TaxID=3110237 RepID=UPI002FD879FB